MKNSFLLGLLHGFLDPDLDRELALLACGTGDRWFPHQGKLTPGSRVIVTVAALAAILALDLSMKASAVLLSAITLLAGASFRVPVFI